MGGCHYIAIQVRATFHPHSRWAYRALHRDDQRLLILFSSKGERKDARGAALRRVKRLHPDLHREGVGCQNLISQRGWIDRPNLPKPSGEAKK